MFCPPCNKVVGSYVVDSRPYHRRGEHGVWRVRECKECGYRWETMEQKLHHTQKKAIWNWSRKREKLLNRLLTMKIAIEELIAEVKKA